MSQLGVLLQERETSGTTALTILRLLREEMEIEMEGVAVDFVGIRRRRWKRSLKERIGGLNRMGMGCCGAPFFFGPTTNTNMVLEVEQGAGGGGQEEVPAASEDESSSPAGMNLAAALAAERQYRALQEAEAGETVTGRVSLMKLLEAEADGGGEEWMCCVCTGRKKGAAFIPCGHTYCRVCSRELWLNRGTCPLCNRPILDILHIF